MAHFVLNAPSKNYLVLLDMEYIQKVIFMFKRILCIFLAVVLIFSLSACQEVIIRHEESVKEAAIELETSGQPDFTLPENYIAPQYNGKLIAGEKPDPETLKIAWPDEERFWKSEEKYSKPTKELQQKIDAYSGQDVWFRVIIKIWETYDNEEIFTEKTLNYLKSMGGYDIKPFNSSEGNNIQDFEVSLTVQMIKLLENKYYQLFLGQYPRNPEHSRVISDTLSIKLDRIGENETIEVAAVCTADNDNLYGEHQHITVNRTYNSDRFKPFKELANISYAEYNRKIDKYLADIYERNNIEKKIIISDDLPLVKKVGSEWRLETTINGDILTEFCIGFNANLTKSEILKLAKDSEIKVIYLAPEKEKPAWPH